MKKTTIAIITIAILSTILFGAYYLLIYRSRDLTGPEISADEQMITVSIKSPESALLKGMKAMDDVDGDVTDSLIVESVRMEEGTTCYVTYAACDRSNNVSKYYRYVSYQDYTPPRFHIVDRLHFPVGTSNGSILECLKAEDCIDGDISNKIRLTGDIQDANADGIYEYTISVTNSIEDTVTMPVAVEYYTDTTENRLYNPQIFLREYLVYVPVGSEFHPKRYLDHLELGSDFYVFSSSTGSKVIEDTAEEAFKTTTKDGKVISGTIHLSAIRMDSNVDTNRPGNYKVTFSCTTKEGYFGSVQMNVIVV